MDGDKPKTFERVLADELRYFKDKYKNNNAGRFVFINDDQLAGTGPEDHPANIVELANAAKLTGLAFSGGGIRSATFNLGVLQTLAKRELINQFDYLSTVSGGGYIGSWLTSWIYQKEPDDEEIKKEPEKKGIDYVEEELASSITVKKCKKNEKEDKQISSIDEKNETGDRKSVV